MTMSVVGGQPKKGTQIPVIKQLLRLGSLLAFFAPLVSREVFLIFTLLTHLYARRVTLFLRANLSEKCQ